MDIQDTIYFFLFAKMTLYVAILDIILMGIASTFPSELATV